MPKTHATSTSFSRASDFEKCPLFFKFRHLDKIPDPAPVITDSQGNIVERPMERGSRIHQLAEDFVQDERMALPEELESLAPELLNLRKLYKKGMMTPEAQYAFDENWKQCSPRDWENARYRAVIDVQVEVGYDRVLIADYKTGKKQGNEIKHHEQCMEYAVCLALVAPSIQIFNVEIWYIDLPAGENKLKKVFTRSEVLAAFKRMKNRHQQVLEARIFPATPSRFACMFCPYKAGTVGFKKQAYAGTGHCRENMY